MKQVLFETKQAAMMFAAAVGYRFGSRKPLDSGGEGIRWNIFEKNRDEAFINALALAAKKDHAVLDPDGPQNEELATIFEEYAAGGPLPPGRATERNLGYLTLDCFLFVHNSISAGPANNSIVFMASSPGDESPTTGPKRCRPCGSPGRRRGDHRR